MWKNLLWLATIRHRQLGLQAGQEKGNLSLFAGEPAEHVWENRCVGGYFPISEMCHLGLGKVTFQTFCSGSELYGFSVWFCTFQTYLVTMVPFLCLLYAVSAVPLFF